MCYFCNCSEYIDKYTGAVIITERSKDGVYLLFGSPDGQVECKIKIRYCPKCGKRIK